MNATAALFLLIPLLLLWALWGEFSSSIAAFFTGNEVKPIEEAGTWGDSFGGLTSLLSSLGTILVLITLFLQRNAISDQARDLHRQRFEATFFEMLGLIRELRSELTYRFSPSFTARAIDRINGNGKAIHRLAQILDEDTALFNPLQIYRGRAAVTAAMIDARYYVGKLGVDRIKREQVGQIYADFIQPRAEPTFSPYFRLIYSVLDRLREDNILSGEEKDGYSRILRSQLTSHELSIIAINACAPVSKDMFDLVCKYRVLKYHPPSGLDNAVRRIYPEVAYTARPETRKDRGSIRDYL